MAGVPGQDITNASIQVWTGMPCFRFKLTDNAGVNHFELPGDEAVSKRPLPDLDQSRSVCPDVP